MFEPCRPTRAARCGLSSRRVARSPGTVFDAAGKPVRGAMVKVVRKDGSHRKATATDANGKFALRGPERRLDDVRDRPGHGYQADVLPADGPQRAIKIGLEVRLKPISLPADLKTYTVLGMQLADMTPNIE